MIDVNLKLLIEVRLYICYINEINRCAVHALKKKQNE